MCYCIIYFVTYPPSSLFPYLFLSLRKLYQKVKLLICGREVSDSKHCRDPYYPVGGLSLFSSVPPSKIRDGVCD